jgi:hypothetical protein
LKCVCPREDLSRSAETILGQEFVEDILKQAKQNLKEDGSVAPMLFMRLQNGDNGILPLALPATHEEREDYFTAIGLTFLSAGKMIHEALLLSETWYVQADQNQRLPLDVAPSQHPKRREAITIVGRDAERTRYTMVVQVFGRDRHQRPVFEPLAVAEYNTIGGLASGPVGLLDHLFPRRSRVLN